MSSILNQSSKIKKTITIVKEVRTVTYSENKPCSSGTTALFQKLPSHTTTNKSIIPGQRNSVSSSSPLSSTTKAQQGSSEPTSSVEFTNKPSAASGSSSGKFPDECLQWHNYYRAKHGVPPLKLSTELCSYAQEWANHLAKTDNFQHRSNRKYGENIHMGWSSDPKTQISGKDPVENWYSEIKDYVFGKEPRTLASGHFTQVVWRSSTELGVAHARSKSNKIIVVANYSPAGNVVGSFSANVPPPK